MDGMCVALGCVYQMYRFIVSVMLRSIARDRLVLALAQDTIWIPYQESSLTGPKVNPQLSNLLVSCSILVGW